MPKLFWTSNSKELDCEPPGFAGRLVYQRGEMMKCGVKFCGGCNPRFDRGEVYQAIRNTLQNEMTFEYAEEGTPYDVLLVIGGCTNCCASYDQYKVRRGVIKIYDRADLEKTITILKDFE